MKLPSYGLRVATAGIPGEHGSLPDVVQTQIQEYDTFQTYPSTAVRGAAVSSPG